MGAWVWLKGTWPGRFVRRNWVCLKETPHMAISLLLFAASLTALTLLWGDLDWTSKLVYFTLLIGSVAALAGRYREDVDVESAGLGWLCAALVFVFARQLPDVLRTRPLRVELAGVISLVLNVGALLLMYSVRLIVCRKAARAQRVAAKINARKGTAATHG